MNIPYELVKSVARGDTVLFVGHGLTAGAPGEEGLPSLAALTGELADATGAWDECRECRQSSRCLHPNNCALPFPKLAGHYVQSHSRNSLIRLLRERLPEEATPLRAHRALAQLPLHVVVYAGYDHLLETALQQAGRQLLVVARDTDILYDDPDRVQVIRLYGKLDDPDTLVLTENDRAGVFGRLPTVNVVLRGHLASKTLLFLGFDLTDPYFQFLYHNALQDLDRHQRPAWAVQWPCRRVHLPGVRLIEAEPTAFLEALAGAVAERAAQVEEEARLESLPEAPYKFLDYFEAGDRGIFFGRDNETSILLSRILAHKVTVLYGHSGVGKTSVLRAGVVPRLEDTGYRTIYVRPLSDPAQRIKRAMLGEGESFKFSPRANVQGLRGFLEETVRPGERLILFLDQFEEFFIRLGDKVQRDFVAEVADSLSSEQDVRFVFSLREEYLGRLDAFSSQEGGYGTLPRDALGNRFRLRNLNEEKAHLAIVEPARQFGLAYEDTLLSQLLADLEDWGVEPAQLQIVCHRLYETLPPGQTTFTLTAYNSLGGTARILRDYLDDVLAVLEDEAEQEGARMILKHMITAERTKLALSAQEIAQGDLVGRSGLPEATVRKLMNFLVGRRVVRVLGEEERYELAHEVMVDKVWEWVDEADLARMDVRDMLRREMSNYQKFAYLLTVEKLDLVASCCEELALSEEELDLLFRSALSAGQEVGYWFERAQAASVPVGAIAREGLESEDFRTRIGAVGALGQLGEEFAKDIVGMLADLYLQVRVAAIHALERLQPLGEWRNKLVYECYVPAGVFVMGDDQSKYNDEKPAHEVHLEAYYIGKYPVTNAKYKRYCDDIGRPFEIPAGKADHPVVNVSWYEARDYALWAGMHLPTEAEWEKAASWDEPGHKKRKYPWGDIFDSNMCNVRESGIGATTPVREYSPQGDSPCGAADMAGNVWEWVSSLYREYPYQSDSGRESIAMSDFRVLRGGAFTDRGEIARTEYRSRDGPNGRGRDLGFRVCLSAYYNACLEV